MRQLKNAKQRETRRSRAGLPGVERLDLERFEPRYAMAALFPYDQTFKLDSLPTATKTIYLDFTGHRIQGTAWNVSENDTEIVCAPFSLDGSPTFSRLELEYIQEVWAYVSEEFRPFEVNVSTREATGTPVLQDIIFSGGSDDRWGVRCVISDASTDENPSPPGQGVALLNSFQSADDTPCFVDTDGLGGPEDIAMVAAHEIGHSLGLEHHGISSVSGVPGPISPPLEYYPGHTNGQLSWGAIMGAPYGQKMTQWSHGEYASASRPYQDDLAILTDGGVSGFTYRMDAVGDSIANATPVAFVPGNLTMSATGIIEQNTDVDMFQIQVAGVVDIQARPYTSIDATTYAGANLDIGMKIFAADGSVVALVEPADQIDVRFTGTLTSGTYYVGIYGTGNADPLVDGYTNYGSLGTYSLTTTVVPTPSVFSIAPLPGQVVAEGNLGLQQVNYAITLGLGIPMPATPLTVEWRTVDGNAKASEDYVAASGTATFAPGTTTVILPISVKGDTKPEADEAFTIELFNPSAGAIIATGQGSTIHTILNEDGPLTVGLSAASQSVLEGHLGKTAVVITVSIDSPPAVPVSVTYTTQDGTATAGGGDYEAKTGTITIPAGQTAGSATVFVLGDRILEGGEAFSVNLSNPVGAVLGALASQTVTIVNDDVFQADPGITVSSPSIREGNIGSVSMVFTITLSRAVATSTTLWVRTVDGTAIAGSDYVALPPTAVTIAKNRRQATVTVRVKGDRVIEQNEVFYLDVSRSSSFTAATRASGTIVNDDLAPIKAAFASLASAAPTTTAKKKTF